MEILRNLNYSNYNYSSHGLQLGSKWFIVIFFLIFYKYNFKMFYIVFLRSPNETVDVHWTKQWVYKEYEK